jgi:hypothetical protein
MSKAQELQARVVFLTARAAALQTQTLAAIAVPETQNSAAISARILIAVENLTKGMGEFVALARYYEGVVPTGALRFTVLQASTMYDKDTTDTVAPAYVEFLAPIVESLLNQAEAALATPADAQAFGDSEGAALDFVYLIRTKGYRAGAAASEKVESFSGEEGARLGLALGLLDDVCTLSNECDSLGDSNSSDNSLDGLLLALTGGKKDESPLKKALSTVGPETLVSVALPGSLKVVVPVIEQIYAKVVELSPELKLA